MFARLKQKFKANANAAATLIGILVFVVLFYLTVIVRYYFQEAINTTQFCTINGTHYDAATCSLMASVDSATDGGLKLAGIGPIVIAAVFILSLVLGLVAFAGKI